MSSWTSANLKAVGDSYEFTSIRARDLWRISTNKIPEHSSQALESTSKIGISTKRKSVNTCSIYRIMPLSYAIMCPTTRQQNCGVQITKIQKWETIACCEQSIFKRYQELNS